MCLQQWTAIVYMGCWCVSGSRDRADCSPRAALASHSHLSAHHGASLALSKFLHSHKCLREEMVYEKLKCFDAWQIKYFKSLE